MSKTATLVKFDAARKALDEARTLDEVKDVGDKAEALRIYAKQQGESLEIQNNFAAIRQRAIYKIATILAELERGKPGPELPDTLAGNSNYAQAIQDINISERTAERWQLIVAELSVGEHEGHMAKVQAARRDLTLASTLQLAQNKRRQRRRQEIAQAEIPVLPSEIQILEGDFEQVGPTLPDASIDVIITDPPYPREYLRLYGILAEQAARLLKPGGSLLAMAGQSYLPDIFSLMTPHLNYHWTVAYLTPGGQAPHIHQRNVNAFWKPVLWFVRGKYDGDCVGDVAKSVINDNDKRFHDWGQSESGMADLVRRFSKPGDLILDPFCGAGTTGVVAVALGRKFTGIDVDSEKVAISKARIVEVLGESE